MKVLLALGVLLAVSVALSSAQCFASHLKLNWKTGQAGCVHKGKFHKIGSHWILHCENCSCTKTAMNCCSMVRTPVQYDTKNCEAIFHNETCSYTVTRKKNPSVKCEVLAFVA